MSLFNNASAGEYGGITVITENAGVWMMVLMTLIINARYMLMSCALSQKLSPIRRSAFGCSSASM